MDYLNNFFHFHPDAFHLMVLFGATTGVVAVPAILGLVATLLERE
jgi:hypothetical protein